MKQQYQRQFHHSEVCLCNEMYGDARSGMLTNQKKRRAGIIIRSLEKNSPFYRTGLRKGDTILRINRELISNDLEFHYFAAEEYLEIEIDRKGKTYYTEVERSEGDSSGITFREQPIQRCANKCVFCFIDQMPKGLRKRLYIKDEDIRLSLFNGNYVTLSTFNKTSLEQIVRIGLSPLYISVHATDTVVRNRMLGNRTAPDILKQLTFLAGHGIRVHTQLVVCPGYNDGGILTRSLRDLLKLGDALLSVAVVPVGLTRFHVNGLSPVGKKEATAICRDAEKIAEKACVRDGFRKIFCADELFIKAGLPIPEDRYYEDYPQMENGVGLVRQFYTAWGACKEELKKIKKRKGTGSSGKTLLVTSVSAYPFVQNVCNQYAEMSGNAFQVIAVVNRFFGESVTVAGLLTATDVIRTVKKELEKDVYRKIVLPGAMFNYNAFTLDGYSLKRIEKNVGVSVTVVELPEEFVVIDTREK